MKHIDDIRLALYAGGELSPEDNEEVATHLAECPRCAAFAEEICTIRGMMPDVGATEPPSLPAEFTDRVMKAVSPLRNSYERKRLYRSLRWYAAAVIALVLGGILWATLPGNHAVENPAPESSAGKEQVQVNATIDARLLQLLPVDGPFPVTEYMPGNMTGLYILMYRPPDTAERFAIGYVGLLENTGGITSGLECLEEHQPDLPRDKIYYVIYNMPNTSELECRQAANALIRAYRPYCNNGV